MGSIAITDPITITIIILCALFVLFIALMFRVHHQNIKKARKENGTGVDLGPRGSIADGADEGALPTQVRYPSGLGAGPTWSAPVWIERGVQNAERATSPQQYEDQQSHIEGNQTSLPSPTYPDSVYPVSTLPSYPGTVRSLSPPAYSDLSRAQSWRTLNESTRNVVS